MTGKKRIGAGIVLSIAIGTAAGLVLGFFHVNPSVGAAISGGIIGTGLALAVFLSAPDTSKRDYLK